MAQRGAAETSGEATPEPVTPGREWLEKLAEEKGNSVEKIAKTDHRMLFDSWNKIEDAELKRAVFQEIKRTYQTKGWWDNPLTNNMKQTLNKYKEYEAKEIEG